MREIELNPRVSRLLRCVTALEAMVLLAAGGGLFLLPAVLRELWPWTLPPFNTAFLGAVYLAALVPAARLVAALIGVAFAAAGLAGFVPALTPPPPAGAPSLTVSLSYGYLVGLFPVNALHSLFHLGMGILRLLASRRLSTARAFCRLLAVTLGALTIAGAVPPFHTLLGLAPLFGHDIWLHAAEAVVAGYVGFVVPRPIRSTSGTRRDQPSINPTIRLSLDDRRPARA